MTKKTSTTKYHEDDSLVNTYNSLKNNNNFEREVVQLE